MVTALFLPQNTQHTITMQLVLSRGTSLGCSVFKHNNPSPPAVSTVFLPRVLKKFQGEWTNHVYPLPLNKSSVYSASTSYGLHMSGPALPGPRKSFVLPDFSRGGPGVLRRLKSPMRSIRINSM